MQVKTMRLRIKKFKISVFLVLFLLYGCSNENNNKVATPFSSFILTVARDGSGDFNCDGKDDEVQINQAIDSLVHKGGGTLHIKAGQYEISSNIIINGDSILIKGDGWDANDNSKGTFIVLKEMSPDTVDMLSGSGFKNVVIKKIKMSAQRWNQKTPIRPLYDHWYFIMRFSKVNHVTIDSMWMGDNYMDIINLVESEHVTMKNSYFIYAGHSSCYAIKSQYISMINNYFELRANSGFRTDNGNHFLFENNVVTCYKDKGADFGIETIQRNDTPALTDFIIRNNKFYNIQGAAIVLTAGEKAYAPHGVVIKNNIIYHCGVVSRMKEIGGILLTNINNAVIENNTIFNNRENGIWFGSDWYYDVKSPIKATVKNNIIGNNTKYGIVTSLLDTLIGGYNDVWGNVKGNYKGCRPLKKDISVGPAFVSAPIRKTWELGKTGLTVDLHLRSKMGRWDKGRWKNDAESSPCIDAGDPTSDYTFEPQPNGNRINMGGYGNTFEASKSK